MGFKDKSSEELSSSTAAKETTRGGTGTEGQQIPSASSALGTLVPQTSSSSSSSQSATTSTSVQAAPAQASAVEARREPEVALNPPHPRPQDDPSRSILVRPAFVHSQTKDKGEAGASTTLASNQQPTPHAADSDHALGQPVSFKSQPVNIELSQSQPAQRAPVATLIAQGSSFIQVQAPPAAQVVFPPINSRSAEFWYPDGNIIVQVEGAYFNLLQSRLQRHCEYFKHVFENRDWTNTHGQKVVELRQLKLQDFVLFLKYLEIPM